MPDRAEVISQLERCTLQTDLPILTHRDACAICHYKRDGRCNFTSLMADALALLKEQEPVKPVYTWNTYLCGNCIHNVYHEERQGCLVLYEERYTYCPNCGRKVKWDEQ